MTSPNKLCYHWTAGAWTPCIQDLKSYHYVIDKDGNVYKGKFKPEDNNLCKPGTYAMHCGGGNTGCIGIAVCGMYGFDIKNKKSTYMITRKSVEALCKLGAELSLKYKIEIAPARVFTHWEFGQLHPKTSSAGKVDIGFLPYQPNWNSQRVADELRKTTNWYKQKLLKGEIKFFAL